MSYLLVIAINDGSRWLYMRLEGDRRSASSTLTALLVFEYACTRHRRRRVKGD